MLQKDHIVFQFYVDLAYLVQSDIARLRVDYIYIVNNYIQLYFSPCERRTFEPSMDVWILDYISLCMSKHHETTVIFGINDLCEAYTA